VCVRLVPCFNVCNQNTVFKEIIELLKPERINTWPKFGLFVDHVHPVTDVRNAKLFIGPTVRVPHGKKVYTLQII
jgi:hypothetical protein